jgi:hypothetical protein
MLISLYPHRLIVGVHRWSGELDVTGEIVNMFRSYPALRRAPLEVAHDDVR